jgi:uncharacterized small protein (DUF1192 family)
MRYFAALLLVAGCGSDTGQEKVDLATAADLSHVTDLPIANTDFRSPVDQRPGIDMTPPDLAVPDLAAPDLAVPDLAAPDLAVPDLAAPDLAPPADQAMPADQSTPADLTGGTADLSGGLNPNGAVNCGLNNVCQGQTPVCCRNTPYGAGQCIKVGDPCGSQTFPCDDPGDCVMGDVCCFIPNVGSACVSAAECMNQMGKRMCQGKNDCAGNEMCCGVGPSPAYYCGMICPISRRDYKKDISYLDDPERKRLADELLRYKLATWRYKHEGEEAPPHLGFIIDDVEPSMSIASDGNSVDLYGYTSLAVAALQEQEARIAALEREVRELRAQKRSKKRKQE